VLISLFQLDVQPAFSGMAHFKYQYQPMGMRTRAGPPPKKIYKKPQYFSFKESFFWGKKSININCGRETTSVLDFLIRVRREFFCRNMKKEGSER